jgi:cobalt-zinc-cadmium efflux system membrane fusion protein
MTATLLLVDDDEVLSQVLRRVLTRAGYTVVEANSAAQALQKAAEQRPDLALLDLRLPDGDGIDLARKLRKQVGPVPLILMTASPLRLRDQPELARGFSHVLTKPLNLDELRQVVEQALASAAVTGQTPPPPTRAASPTTPAAATDSPAARPRRRRLLMLAGAGLVAAALLAVLAAVGMPDLQRILHPSSGTPAAPDLERTGSRLTDRPEEIELSADAAREMGICTEKVPRDVPPRVLNLLGSLTFNPNRLTSVKSLFPGKVISVGTTSEPNGSPSSPSRQRPLRYGDPVKKDDLLAIVLSTSLGEKKNDLVTALVTLHLDEVTLASYEELHRKGNLPHTTLRQQRATVGKDRSDVERARFTLRTWGVSRREIAEVEEEAAEISKREGKRDVEKETEWAKEEIRAPFDGTIVEMSVPLGNYVDTSTDLFKVADLRQLGILVNAYEEDLSTLRALPGGYPWTLRTTADPRLGGPRKDHADRVLSSTGIQQLGVIVDPTQHTLPVLGLVDNFDHKLTVGQFLTASIELPPPGHVIALPIAALTTDGSESVVFVQPDPSTPRYVRRRVAVQARLHQLAYLQTRLTDEQRKQGLEVVRPGEAVVVAGVVELESALDILQAQEKAHHK